MEYNCNNVLHTITIYKVQKLTHKIDFQICSHFLLECMQGQANHIIYGIIFVSGHTTYKLEEVLIHKQTIMKLQCNENPANLKQTPFI